MRSERPDYHAEADTSDEILAISLCAERGLGVRLLTTAAPGDVLDRFDGLIGPELSQHSLQVAPGWHIAGTRYIGFLSHGCEPNCRLDMARRELVALRPLAADAWLTIDYAATEDELYRQFACRCGASACRGWIIGRADRISPEGAAHLARAGTVLDRA